MGRQKSDIKITKRDREHLQQILRHSTGDSAPLRAMIILVSEAGLSSEQIARLTGVSSRTVRDARKRWRSNGAEGLHDVPRSGRPNEADADFIRLLIQTTKRDPHKMGYAFSRWTAPRLSTYMTQKTGVKLSPPYISELLQTHRVVWGKSKLTISNLSDPVEKKTCREMAQTPSKSLENAPCTF